MRSYLGLVLVAGCATAPANPCSMAAEHVASCTADTSAIRIDTCNEQRADAVLALECSQLRTVAEAAKASGWWDDFLCALELSDHCLVSRADRYTMVGAIHHLDDSPAVAVYVRVIKDGTPSDVRGSWTFEGGLFAVRDLEQAHYRLEVAMTPTSATLFSRELDGEPYVELQAPIPH